MEDPDLSQYLNLGEAAKACGLVRTSLYYYLERDEGPPCLTVGGRRFFHPDRLSAWNDRRLLSVRKRRRRED